MEQDLFDVVRRVASGTSGVVRLVIRKFDGVKVNGLVCTDDHRAMVAGDVVEIGADWSCNGKPIRVTIE